MTGEQIPRLERMEIKLDKVVDTLTQVSVLNERLVNYINEQQRMGARVEKVEDRCQQCAVNEVHLVAVAKDVTKHGAKIEALEGSKNKLIGWAAGVVFVSSAVATVVSKLWSHTP
jgi:hypothetical protein